MFHHLQIQPQFFPRHAILPITNLSFEMPIHGGRGGFAFVEEELAWQQMTFP
jgi:hypothetical protein